MNEYGLFDAQPGSGAVVTYIESQSQPGKTYMVVAPIDADGAWYCSCPAHKYRPGHECRHIKEVRNRA